MTRVKLRLTAQGENDPDIEDALEEVLRLIREGFTSGQASNETGEFVFSCTAAHDSNGH